MGKGKPSQKFKPRNDDEAKAKWLHAKMKQLKKALKKAKQFEILKITRRMKSGPTSQKGQSELDESKLHAQLEAAKSLDLDELAVKAARGCGMLGENEGGTTVVGLSSTSLGASHRVVQDRLLRAGSVRKELLNVLSVYNKKFKTRLSAPVAASEGKEEEEEEEEDEEEEEEAVMLGRVTERNGPLMADQDPEDSKEVSEDPSGLIVDYDLDCLYEENEEEEEEDKMTGISQRKEGPEAQLDDEENEEEEEEEEEEGGNTGNAYEDDDNDSIDSRQWDQPVALNEKKAAGGRTLSLKALKALQTRNQNDLKALEARDEDEEMDEGADGSEDSRQWDLPSKASLSNSVKGKGTKLQDGEVQCGSLVGIEAEVKKPFAKSSSDKPSVTRKKYDPKKDDPLTKKNKMTKSKNRLGQNARRKLAEAQFGREARHLRQQEEEKRREMRASREGGSKLNSVAVAKKKDANVVDVHENLHPSWAAKRKLSINAVTKPQGTKIKFDDEEGGAGSTKAGGMGKKAEEKLHPSWEAKKKAEGAKSVLSMSGKGSKIKFND